MKPIIRRDVELLEEWTKVRKKLDDMILLHAQKPTNFSFEAYEPVEEFIIQLSILARKIKRCKKLEVNTPDEMNLYLDVDLFNDMYTKIVARIKKYIRHAHGIKIKKPMDLYALLER